MSSKSTTALRGPAAQEFRYPRASSSEPDEAAQNAAAKPVWIATDAPNPESDPASSEKRDRQAWKRGFDEGNAQARAEYEKNLATLRSETGKALRDFATERNSYFHRVEQEVVRLTLAIARKILHRESQLDPLLLTGVLRVALEKIEAGTKTRLRANPADIKVWREYFLHTEDKFPAPELVADSELERFRCVLETEIGTAEIGLETQLKEIEQGFLDLLSQRPGGG